MSSSKSILRMVLLSFGVLLAFLLVALNFTSYLHDVLEADIEGYLSEIAQASQSAASAQITSHFLELEALASLIEIAGSYAPANILSILDQYASMAQKFHHLGVILPDGTGYAANINGTNFSDRDYFHRALEGSRYIASAMPDRTTGRITNTCAVPLYHRKKVVAVIAADIETRSLSESLGISTFEGAGFSLIADAHGHVTIPAWQLNSPNFLNLSRFQFEDGLSFAQVVAQGKGVIGATYLKCRYYMAYLPLGINHWYLLSLVPQQVIERRLDLMMDISMVSWLLISLLFLSIILYILYTKAKSQKAMEILAFQDEVTGFSNWKKFQHDARNFLDKYPDDSYALISLDVNKFKLFNDLYGHKKGNETLTLIAWALSQTLCLRETFGRINADNFDLLVRYQQDQDIIARIQQLSALLGDLSLSFGIYKIQDRSLSINICSDRAALAKLSIKNNRDLSFCFFDGAMRSKMLLDDLIEKEMHQALKAKEFLMFLQPKFNIQTNRYCGAEALVRWQHPQRGLLSPNDFIPQFEKNGFITQLDMEILKQACQRLHFWQTQGLELLPISVNFSRLDFMHSDFSAQVMGICDQYQVPHQLIELEITESSMFGDTHLLLEISKKMQNAGFLIAMDDFGSGYSSMNMLKSIPLDVIKFDQGFFTDDQDTAKNRILITDLISLIKRLGITVVAEGIESFHQVEMLRQAHCDIIQGYYYSKPLRPEAFDLLIREAN